MRSRSSRGASPGVLAEDAHLSAVAPAVALEDLHRRRLSGPVRPEEPEHLALGDLEADAPQRLDPVVGLPEITGDDRAGHIWPIH